jgi:hypothetical protein
VSQGRIGWSRRRADNARRRPHRACGARPAHCHGFPFVESGGRECTEPADPSALSHSHPVLAQRSDRGASLVSVPRESCRGLAGCGCSTGSRPARRDRSGGEASQTSRIAAYCNSTLVGSTITRTIASRHTNRLDPTLNNRLLTGALDPRSVGRRRLSFRFALACSRMILVWALCWPQAEWCRSATWLMMYLSYYPPPTPRDTERSV